MSETSFSAPESPRFTPPGVGPDRALFWTRFGASFLDGIPLTIVAVVLQAVMNDNAGQALGFLIAIVSFTYFEGSTGQTPGKRAMNIRVVDEQTGAPIGYGRALLRYVGRIISTIPLFLGYFWMLWDGNRQTWHDKIANDVVVPISY